MSAAWETVRAVAQDIPKRLVAAFTDPVRLRHIVSRVAETFLPGSSAFLLLGHGWWSFLYAAGLALGEFLLYELVLEPLGHAGPYWERGPRPGETYKEF